MIIRPIDPIKDANEIADIYAWYVDHSTATFELRAPTSEDMASRLQSIALKYPAFVCEEEGLIAGYCYAHLWKAFAAYSQTLETTIYLRPGTEGKGIGRVRMERLIAACREQGISSLIACITAENEGSRRFHESLGFRQVSDFKAVGRKFGRDLSVTDYQLML